MKILKKIIIVLVIIIAIPLIIALFINGKYEVVKEVTINKPKTEVFDYLKHLKNQDNFSVWNQRDPDMKKGFEGTDGEVGAIAKWDSQNEEVGAGEQEIVNIEEGSRIDMELRFLKPFESKGDAYFTVEGKENSTIVKWGFAGESPYPMNIMMLFMDMEEMLGPDLQQGLDNLKELLESMEASRKIEISEIEVTAQPILYIEESSKLNSDSIALKIGEAYGEIMAFMGVNELEMTSAPLAITTEFSMEEMFWAFNPAIVVELPEGLEPVGRIKAGTTYEGKALKGIHVGPYSESMATYNALEKYVKENGLEMNGQPWEEYVDDPTKVSETELRTFIYFPVK